MTSFADWSIRTKVTAAFALVLAATVGLGIVAIDRLAALNATAAEIRDNWLPSTRDIGMLAALSERYRLIEALAVMADEDGRKAMEKALGDTLTARDKVWQSYQSSITPGEEKKLADAIAADWLAYVAQSRQVTELAAKNEKDKALAIFRKGGLEIFARIRTNLDADLQLNATGGTKEAERGEALYNATRPLIIGAVIFAALLCLAAGWALVAGVSKPILRMVESMGRLAKHELDAEIVGVGRKDEIGRMAEAVQVFKTGLVEADRLAAEQHAEEERKERRRITLEQNIADFDRSIRGLLDTVAAASTELRATAESMSATAEETSRQATGVASAAEQASTNVQTVAAASEEMAASIGEISRQVTQSSGIANEAVAEAERTNRTVEGLADAASKIGEVVSLIDAIASQTNLLALNATIEAARAGDAGKGFAVVAAEVKSLAQQTSKATEEIGAQVTSIQAVTKDAVEAIRTIGATITKISEISAGIASAVEEQGAATHEITRNTQEAAKGTQEVSVNVVGVNQAAAETGTSASHVLSASSELDRQAEQLRQEVDQFLVKIRAA
jgi:methyl-accepting chemotaxis protein